MWNVFGSSSVSPVLLSLVTITILLLLLILTRIYYILPSRVTKRKESRKNRVVGKDSCTVMVILGSGGHTREMISLIRNIDREKKYRIFYYIVAETDTTSVPQIPQHPGNIIFKIPRSRTVGQSYLTSIFTTIYSFSKSVGIYAKTTPDVIITNGPGTCIPMVISSYVFKLFFFGLNTKVIFIESFCRTSSLSVTGKIMYYLANRFVVQWPGLKVTNGTKTDESVEYLGRPIC